MSQQLHRRTPSHEDDENNIIVDQAEFPRSDGIQSAPRTRVSSTPTIVASQSLPPMTGGPYKPGMSSPGPPASPFRSGFATSGAMHGHSRTRSISTPYSPSLPSPLSFSFPNQSTPTEAPPSPKPNPNPSRRHARLHSRNLSVFFPRPGSLPESTISEDGSQEIEVREEAPVTTIPSASPSASMRRQSERQPPTPLGAGFTFGGRPAQNGLASSPPPMSAGATSRRGHHHKHSLSHNFFSFLEPGVNPPSPAEELHTHPTITPVSPWTQTTFPTSPTSPAVQQTPVIQNASALLSESTSPFLAGISSLAQFLLGAWLWVSGQQIGSLSCTGLGYWVVFDSFGIAVKHVLPWWLDKGTETTERVARAYGNGRLRTLFTFSQSVYLMFSSVYVCKETVEHVLLSAGNAEGHHHHSGDENSEFGIEFPVALTTLAFISILLAAVFFENHAHLAEIAGNRIPSPSEFIRSLSSGSGYNSYESPASTTGRMLSNPYISSQLLFCLALVFVATSIPASQHRTCDLLLASLITAITFRVAYQASTILGTVLLQTAPRRGAPGGRMEAFLRAMRDVERHPQVLHLPAPHFWQLTAGSEGSTDGTGTSMVITLEVHVSQDLGDDDVLSLTHWTWERCMGALSSGPSVKQKGSQVEVTVGVVRG